MSAITEYIYPDADAAKAAKKALPRHVQRRARLRASLPLYRHGGSPGWSVFVKDHHSFGERVETCNTLADAGGKKRKDLQP